jgi:hypothetical protein
MAEQVEQAKPETKEPPKTPETKEPEKVVPTGAKTEGVLVTKGGISKYVDPSQVATYKANGWT